MGYNQGVPEDHSREFLKGLKRLYLRAPVNDTADSGRLQGDRHAPNNSVSVVVGERGKEGGRERQREESQEEPGGARRSGQEPRRLFTSYPRAHETQPPGPDACSLGILARMRLRLPECHLDGFCRVMLWKQQEHICIRFAHMRLSPPAQMLVRMISSRS